MHSQRCKRKQKSMQIEQPRQEINIKGIISIEGSCFILLLNTKTFIRLKKTRILTYQNKDSKRKKRKQG